MKDRLPKYLARPTDGAVWSINPDGKTFSNKASKEKNPTNDHHKTPYQVLIDFEFYPVEEKDFMELERIGREYREYQNWANRPDGHGGVQGGTIEEFRKERHKLKK